MCADFVPVSEDSNQWRRFYKNQAEGVDHNIAEFMLGVSTVPPAIAKNLATDQHGNQQASASAENVVAPYSLPEPEAYDDPRIMSRKKYRRVGRKAMAGRGKKKSRSSSYKRKKTKGRVTKRSSGTRRKRPSLSKRRR